MVTNEYAGSGGDAMPWISARAIGTLVGTRTWGGLVGDRRPPPLMDGGTVTSPDFGFFSPTGEWDVENHGVTPDVMVEMDPKLVAEGHDPQLERAVAVAMEKLAKIRCPSRRSRNIRTIIRSLRRGRAAARRLEARSDLTRWYYP